jgi:hypothetical protein
VLAPEHLLDLACLDNSGELLDARCQLRGDILALAGPVDEDTNIICFGGKGGD